jgi:hypothetical protein
MSLRSSSRVFGVFVFVFACASVGAQCGSDPGNRLSQVTCQRGAGFTDPTYGFFGRPGENGCDAQHRCVADVGQAEGTCLIQTGCQPGAPPYTNGYYNGPSPDCPAGYTCEMRAAPPVGRNLAGTCIQSQRTEPVVLACGAEPPTSFVHDPGRQVDYYVQDCDLVIEKPTVVQPGTVIGLPPTRAILVRGNGSFKAVGRSDARIVLQRSGTAAWGGLMIFSKSPDNQLQFVDVKGAGSSRPEGKANVIVGQQSFAGGSVSIRDCVLGGSDGDGLQIGVDGSVDAFERNQSTGNQGFPVSTWVDGVGALSGPGNKLTGNTNDLVHVVASDKQLNKPVSWAKLDVPYLVSGTATLTSTHTFAPGVTVVMDQDALLVVAAGTAAGTLKMEGTAADPIVVRGQKSPSGYFGGILVQGNTASSIRNTRISGGGGSNNAFSTKAPVTLDPNAGGATVSIRDCVLESSAGWGVFLSGQTANPDIATANTFSNNALGNVSP